MEYNTKRDLINGLNDAINAPAIGEKDLHRHFDPATGTIYCENHKAYDKKSIETARGFMEAKAKSYADDKSDGFAKVYDIARTVIDIYLEQLTLEQK
jgi:hypothetical protein